MIAFFDVGDVVVINYDEDTCEYSHLKPFNHQLAIVRLRRKSNEGLIYYDLSMRSNETIQLRRIPQRYLRSLTPDDFLNCSKKLAISELAKKQLVDDPIPTKYTPKKIIYHDIATIVFWMDGTKTVVKLGGDEKNNRYTAFCAALAKKVYGNNSRVNKIVKTGIDETDYD